MNNSIRYSIATPALLAILAGCSSTEINPALDQARNVVRDANGDPVVVAEAPVDLDRARDSLAQAEAIFEEEGNDEAERVEHYSYLATRYAQTAIARANESRARDEIEAAEAERSAVLLEIRTADAERSEAQAAVALAAAAQTEREAELAERQAAAAQSRAITAELRAESAEQRAQAATTQANRLAEQLANLEAQRTDRGLVLTLGDVLFDTDEAELKPDAAGTIDQLAQFLGEYPERSLIIEGHTDSTGPEAYNQMLSERRARAVADALIARNIDRSRLEVRGLGESQPVATNETSAGRQENRRVDIVISDD